MTRLKTTSRETMGRKAHRRTSPGAAERGRTAFQTTVREPIALEGLGVHSNARARIVVHPAEAGAGIAFFRSDLDGEAVAQARWSNVCSTELCTALQIAGTHAVSTVEHLMAALYGLGVDNALVEIDGPETPVLDGSAAGFVEAIDEVGVRPLRAPRRSIEILKTVRVEQGAAFAELAPASAGLTLDVEIRFDHFAIGRQRKALVLDPGVFRRELSRARTFGFLKDLERLWRGGFALGASLDNSIALADEGVLNPGGLRFRDEFVRHKMLDAIGDLALAGAPIQGAFRSFCGGHALNNAVLRALFADSSAWRLTPAAAPHYGEVRPAIGAFAQLALAPDRS
jgi:UDP-3-O-[3-hydroxymyristoyl] N-acetylglucosamine deacetylase